MFDPTEEVTRRQFFARLRKAGFTKPMLELSRNAVSYVNEAGVIITLPKHHTNVVQVLGDVPWSGWHTTTPYASWHKSVPEGWHLLQTILGLVSGDISYAPTVQAESTLIEEDEE